MKIDLNDIVKINKLIIDIFIELNSDFVVVDRRRVVPKERAITHYLSKVTPNKKIQSQIYNIIEKGAFTTDDDGTWKPICDEIRKLGVVVISE